MSMDFIDHIKTDVILYVCIDFSSLLSTPDENGEKHLILCQVLMGNSEQIPAGSYQFHPSNDLFDTAVDDLKSPRWFIVWTTHMNTHILPLYVVTFKSSNQIHGNNQS